jgi:DNA-binding CsgD family transcriptional regulator
VGDVFNLLAKIADAGSIKEVWDPFVARMAQHGFSRVNYGFTRYRHVNSIGNPDDVLYLSSNGPEYVEHYYRSGFYATTPIFRWIVSNTGVCSWRWVDEERAAGRLSAAEIEAIEKNARMGIVAGISISFPENSPRSKGALGLTADIGLTHDDVDRIWEKDGPEILAICNMAHLKMTCLPFQSARRALTDRQREALEWVADGKTTQDIAILMGVSAAAVEKHLKLARDALDVETTAHAVAKASFLNQIFVRST